MASLIVITYRCTFEAVLIDYSRSFVCTRLCLIFILSVYSLLHWNCYFEEMNYIPTTSRCAERLCRLVYMAMWSTSMYNLTYRQIRLQW